MNSVLMDKLKTLSPKIKDLEEHEIRHHKASIGLFATFINDDFFDLPERPEKRFEKDGLYYSIPYFDDNMLYISDNTRDVIVVYQIENGSSFCPFRISVRLVDENEYNIYIHDQSGERSIKRLLVEKEDGKYYSEIPHYHNLKLSDYLNKGYSK